MSKNFLSVTKDKLKKQQEKIKKQLAEISNRNKRKGGYSYEAKFPEYGRSEDENANEVADFADSISLGKSLENSLVETELALKKIDSNQYGICEICKKKINRKRLEILPTARYCLNCKNNRKNGI